MKAKANKHVAHTYMLHNRYIPAMAQSVQDVFKELLSKGWTFHVVDQRCGRCYYYQKVITIPVWVCNNKDEPKHAGELEWYVAHEMAHAKNFEAGTNDAHGPNFMAWLKKICPERSIQWELTYKPQNAKAAGIGQILADDELV